MSQSKFDAAKELIQEKHYDEARAILRTINDEKAKKWLTRLDEIDPPKQLTHRVKRPATPASNEAEKFYREENKARKERKRQRKLKGADKGIELFCGSIGLLAMWVYFNYIGAAQYHNGDGQFHGTTIEIVVPAICIGLAAFSALMIIRAVRAARNVQ